MSIINNVLGIFLGNKYERDLKEINPYVDKIKEEFIKLANISNDNLRDKTDELRKEILGSVESLERRNKINRSESRKRRRQ